MAVTIPKYLLGLLTECSALIEIGTEKGAVVTVGHQTEEANKTDNITKKKTCSMGVSGFIMKGCWKFSSTITTFTAAIFCFFSGSTCCQYPQSIECAEASDCNVPQAL